MVCSALGPRPEASDSTSSCLLCPQFPNVNAKCVMLSYKPVYELTTNYISLRAERDSRYFLYIEADIYFQKADVLHLFPTCSYIFYFLYAEVCHVPCDCSGDFKIPNKCIESITSLLLQYSFHLSLPLLNYDQMNKFALTSKTLMA